MNKIILISVFSIIILISCKKEKLLNINDIIGSWIEQTDQSFKHRLIFETETVYLLSQLKQIHSRIALIKNRILFI